VTPVKFWSVFCTGVQSNVRNGFFAPYVRMYLKFESTLSSKVPRVRIDKIFDNHELETLSSNCNEFETFSSKFVKMHKKCFLKRQKGPVASTNKQLEGFSCHYFGVFFF
jgi:hypothetical protein